MDTKILKIIAIAISFLAPAFQNAHAQGVASGAPPIEQALVREGDFAVQLAERLKIGTPRDEAEAEMMLSSSGISPENGWISDYPVTPDIIGELENTVGNAADAGRLPLGRNEAVQTLRDLAYEVGLTVVADAEPAYPYGGPPEDYPYYSEPVVTDYYNSYGPPIVTYYPPPPSYFYLYAWVPYPFWWTGVHFRGFFILSNFHKRVHVHHRPVFVSNHWRDPRTSKVFVIHPSKRHTGEFIRGRAIGAPKGFTSPEARRGASSIFEQGRGRVAPGAHGGIGYGLPPGSRGQGFPGRGQMINRPGFNRRPGNPPSHGVNPHQFRSPNGNERIGRPVPEARFRERSSAVPGRPAIVNRPNEVFSQGPRGAGPRQGPPSRNFNRSFSLPEARARENGHGAVNRPSGTPNPVVQQGQFGHNPSTGNFNRSTNPPSHSRANSFSFPSFSNRGSFGTPRGRTGGIGFGRGTR